MSQDLDLLANESRMIAAQDPIYHRKRREEELFVRWFEYLHRTGVESIDPERIHRATEVFSFLLKNDGITVEEFLNVEEMLTGFIGTFFKFELGGGRDQDWHFLDGVERNFAYTFRRYQWLEQHEIPHVEAAATIADYAYRLKLSFVETSKEAES
ncbi:MAG: hypothetical protein JWN89_295 [Parcubacteria group bacterium]|nr:hypothetical protein [Parcubacteria group bacterium]